LRVSCIRRVKDSGCVICAVQSSDVLLRNGAQWISPVWLIGPTLNASEESFNAWTILPDVIGDAVDGARKQLKTALSILDKLGERLYASRIEQMLDSLAPRPADG